MDTTDVQDTLRRALQAKAEQDFAGMEADQFCFDFESLEIFLRMLRWMSPKIVCERFPDEAKDGLAMAAFPDDGLEDSPQWKDRMAFAILTLDHFDVLCRHTSILDPRDERYLDLSILQKHKKAQEIYRRYIVLWLEYATKSTKQRRPTMSCVYRSLMEARFVDSELFEASIAESFVRWRSSVLSSMLPEAARAVLRRVCRVNKRRGAKRQFVPDIENEAVASLLGQELLVVAEAIADGFLKPEAFDLPPQDLLHYLGFTDL